MTNQKQIDVRDQAKLTFEKSFKFCLKGISYRLFRSSLTLAVVVVAVAFFTVLLSESMIVRSVSAGVHREMADARESDRAMMHLFHRYSSLDLSAKFAAMTGNAEAIAEFARVTGLPVDEVETLVESCRLEQVFLYFFRNLSPGKRAVLFKKAIGREIFRFLRVDEAFEAFQTALAKMRSVRMPLDMATLSSFLDEYDEYLKKLQSARNARTRKIEAMEGRVSALTGGRDSSEWLGEASDEQVEAWRKIIEDSGFDMPVAKMARIRALLQGATLEARIVTRLQTPEMREAWKVKMKTAPGLEEKLLMLKEPMVGELLQPWFTPEEMERVVDRFARMKHLRKLITKLPPVEHSVVAKPRFLDGRQIFLIVISFLVCMVGITNAMLMSITERFREIATMKCLGATDGFILTQFLIEAAIQGVVGGVVGMVIGMLISIAKSTLIYGQVVYLHFPAIEMLFCAVSTVVIGVLLAMLASIYPSRAAARMAPMDAMRVE